MQLGFRFARSLKELLANVTLVRFTHNLIKARRISGDWIGGKVERKQMTIAKV